MTQPTSPKVDTETQPTQTSFDEVSCFNLRTCEWPECDCPRKDSIPKASTACPICHQDNPHNHSDEEVAKYRQSPALYAEAWRKYYAGTDHHPVYRRIFIEGGLFALSAPCGPSVDAEALIDRIAQWLHDETEHPDSYPEHTWPETEGDDGRREGGFVHIVPKYVQAQFRDIARRLITQFPALAAPRVEPVADDFAEFPYDDERFNKGVQHVVELFAKTLGIDDWEAGDGSEDYDDDLQQTFLNIMEARNIYDPETGLIGFASAAPPSQPDTGVRDE